MGIVRIHKQILWDFTERLLKALKERFSKEARCKGNAYGFAGQKATEPQHTVCMCNRTVCFKLFASQYNEVPALLTGKSYIRFAGQKVSEPHHTGDIGLVYLQYNVVSGFFDCKILYTIRRSEGQCTAAYSVQQNCSHLQQNCSLHSISQRRLS